MQVAGFLDSREVALEGLREGKWIGVLQNGRKENLGNYKPTNLISIVISIRGKQGRVQEPTQPLQTIPASLDSQAKELCR